MGLISKEAALAAIDHEREMLIEQRLIGSEHVVVQHARRLIEDMQTVPAVPLDKLCEWLAGYAEPPLDALTICDNLFEAWKMTLTELMEEQDAAD